MPTLKKSMFALPNYFMRPPLKRLMSWALPNNCRFPSCSFEFQYFDFKCSCIVIVIMFDDFIGSGILQVSLSDLHHAKSHENQTEWAQARTARSGPPSLAEGALEELVLWHWTMGWHLFQDVGFLFSVMRVGKKEKALCVDMLCFLIGVQSQWQTISNLNCVFVWFFVFCGFVDWFFCLLFRTFILQPTD